MSRAELWRKDVVDLSMAPSASPFLDASGCGSSQLSRFDSQVADSGEAGSCQPHSNDRNTKKGRRKEIETVMVVVLDATR